MKSTKSRPGPPANSKQTGGFVSKTKAAEAKKKAEADKLRLAKEAEEAKIAAEKAERERFRSPKLKTDKDKLRDLKRWLKSTPIPEYELDRIDRTFSDGSLMAEVINHFDPNLCDKRPYYKWYSSQNKKNNWEALNYKVFPKLGFKLNQKQINHIVKPFEYATYVPDSMKGFFIYRLLTKVRDKLGAENPAVFDYRKHQNASKSKMQSKSKMAVGKPKAQAAKRKLHNYLEEPLFSRVEMLLENGFYDKKEKIEDKMEEGCEEEVEENVTQEDCECCEQTVNVTPNPPPPPPCEKVVYNGGPFITSVDSWALVEDLQPTVDIQQAGNCFLSM